MKRFAWLSRSGEYCDGERQADGVRVPRVFLVQWYDGRGGLYTLDESRRWWYPTDGGAPVKNARVRRFVDISEIYYGK
jgi:hypothetical protein